MRRPPQQPDPNRFAERLRTTGVYALAWPAARGSLEVRLLELRKGERDKMDVILKWLDSSQVDGGQEETPQERSAGAVAGPVRRPRVRRKRSAACCAELDRLRAEYGDAVDKRKARLGALCDAGQPHKTSVFQTAWQLAAESLQDCLAARAALQKHIEAHGCD